MQIQKFFIAFFQKKTLLVHAESTETAEDLLQTQGHLGRTSLPASFHVMEVPASKFLVLRDKLPLILQLPSSKGLSLSEFQQKCVNLEQQLFDSISAMTSPSEGYGLGGAA